MSRRAFSSARSSPAAWDFGADPRVVPPSLAVQTEGLWGGEKSNLRHEDQ